MSTRLPLRRSIASTQGRVILFVEDLNYRAYWRGANRLFLNAVVLSPSAP